MLSKTPNYCAIQGRLGSTPSITNTQKGRVMNARVAVNKNYKDSNDEWQQSTEWFSVVSWNDRVIDYAAHLKQGALIHASGEISLEQWEKNGEKHASLSLKASALQEVVTFKREEKSAS